jgi:general secretion pathway protein D
MNAHYKLKFFSTLLIVVSLAGCASDKAAFKDASKAELSRDFETAMNEYKKALDANPGNTEYRLKYEQLRFAAAFAHFQKGKVALEGGNLESARTEFARAKEIDPSHDFAAEELARVNQLIAGRKPGAPELPVPDFESNKEATRTLSYQSILEPTLRTPITIHLAQQTRTAFETVAEMAGIHIIFQRDIRLTPPNIVADFDNVSFYQALDLLCLQTKTFWQVVNKNTILIIDDNSTMRRDYEEVVVKTIYLTNATTAQEVNDIMNAIRQNLNITTMTAYPALSALIIKDSPDKVAMAEKLASALDKGKAEVVIEATIMEVDRSLLRDLGIQPPSSATLAFVSPPGTPPNTAITAPVSAATLRELSNINSGSFAVNIPQTVAHFLASSSLAKLIENPMVRATSGQQASLLVGSNVPIQTANTQPTLAGGSTTTNVSYTNVGVSLIITPTVLMNREISIAVNVDIKAPAGDKQVGNTTSPVFTDRNIQHTIRLKEGDTNVLGGIISTTESTSMSGLPILKDIPALKYFFGREQKTRDDVEVIVMLTPHIVHMPQITVDDMRALDVGTVTSPRLPSLTVPGPNATDPAPRPAAPAPVPGVTPLAPPVPFGTPVQPTPANPVQPNPSAAAPSVSFPAGPAIVTSQKATPVTIQVNGLNISGAELTLSYDPRSIVISQVSDGGFLSKDGQLLAVIQVIDPETGKAHISIERPPNASPITGSGNLLTLMVVPQNKKGDSLLRVTEFKMRDAQQKVQSGGDTETTITVQ